MLVGLAGAAPASACSGSDAAFAGVMEAQRGRVYNLCYRLLGEAAEAEDAAQETFLRAYLHRRRYDPARSLTTWLLTIAAHYCIDRLRRRRLVMLSLDDARLAEHPALRAGTPTPEAALLRAEHQGAVEALLRRLAAPDRDVVVMHYWAGFSYAEIARQTSSSVPAVKSRLHRARRRLAELLCQPPPIKDEEHAQRGGALLRFSF
jgi:RNA polymerase sigma-70 factor, ECF subfamily